MKQQNSTLVRADEAAYTLTSMKEFPYTTLVDAAVRLRISPQRLSRLLRILAVPVFRVGYLILLADEAIDRIREAVRKNEVRPGTKKRKDN